jgi:hypothetical protein
MKTIKILGMNFFVKEVVLFILGILFTFCPLFWFVIIYKDVNSTSVMYFMIFIMAFMVLYPLGFYLLSKLSRKPEMKTRFGKEIFGDLGSYFFGYLCGGILFMIVETIIF